MQGNGDFDVSVSGELLYNTKKDDFSPNLFLRVGKDSYGLLGIESMGNDPVYDALYGRMRGDYGVHAGIIRNKIGEKKNKKKHTVRLRGQYALTPNLFLTGQSIFPHNNRGGGEYIGVGYNY